MTSIKIQKRRIVAPIDFGELFDTRTACGVKLEYMELDFIQTGKSVVIFDAYSPAHKYKPFNAECGVVAFPFYFGCMTDDGERVAYAGLRFGENKTVKWELFGKAEAIGLLTVDPDAASVPISSGVCCFADKAAYDEYYSHLNNEVHPLSGHIVLNGQTHTVAELYGHKYAVFSTGWGDGRYRCFIGYDGDGKVAAVIADFGMIDYPKDDSVIEIPIDDAVGAPFVYDPDKSESENNIARWSHVIDRLDENSVEDRMQAYARRGYAYHSVGNTVAALDDYNAAIACSKLITDASVRRRAWSVYDNAAEIYCARGDNDKAIELMTTALDALDTNFNAGVYVRLIDLYRRTGRLDKALEIAERMVLSRKDDPVAYIKHAECCVAVMNYRTAAQSYEVLADRFKLFENLFDCAACLIEIGEFDAALAALERHPTKTDYEQYWYYKACIEYKTHDPLRAVHSAVMAHDIDREYMPALFLLIDALSVLQEYYEVARYAEEYKKLRPDNEYGYSVCAEAHLLLGNYSESAKNYCYIYDKLRPDEKYAALGALVCSASGDVKRAKRMLKKLKKAHSPYFYGVLFGMYANSYKTHVRSISFDRIADTLETDDDFMLLLSEYLLLTDNVRPAARVLDAYRKSGNDSFDGDAQALRVSERLDDKAAFLKRLDEYVSKYFAAASVGDKKELAMRLMGSDKKHYGWCDDIK